MFKDLLDEMVQSVHACGEDIEILENFTYLGSVGHSDGVSSQEVIRRFGLSHVVMDSSTRVFRVVSTCADGRRFRSPSRW